MRLKDYQAAALETLSGYLSLLSDASRSRADELADIEKLPAATREKVRAMLGDPVAEAWKKAQAEGVAASQAEWRPLKDGAGRSIPHVCLKLPTGGGKTLLAAHGVDRILVSHFRQTTGFVLWIVPSEAIFTQTKAQLADRAHPIRQALDRASGGRVKVLEKRDGFTKADLEQKLCVLLMMLQSAGRETKESLKVFQDSGNYTSFFPQDDPPARALLLKQVPNLDSVDLAEAALGGAGAAWVKQSLGNTLRVVRPVIVLDEGHRAYSDLARDTLAGLNPRFVLELTATPGAKSNILVAVGGRELKDEEMIKLPIRLDVAKNVDWRTTLQNAVDRLDALEKAARAFEASKGRYIRPIMLVRVDRTGKEQREKSGDLVHVEDAFEFLTQKAGVAPEAIRRQTAELKELKEDDLFSPYCPVRFIITKDALREGWDCPFAYVLAILSKGTAKTALTQMIGRVLRQPHAKRTEIAMLDETHVFCTDVAVQEAVAKIKSGLESEGMGDVAGDIVTGTGKGPEAVEVQVRFRKGLRGKRIMVPRVLHRAGKKDYRDLDYEADVLAYVDFERLDFRAAAEFPLKGYDPAKIESVIVDFEKGEKFDLEAAPAAGHAVAQRLDRPGLIRRMLGVVPNPWQAARILDNALEALRKRGKEDEIVASRLTLVERMNVDLQEQVEAAAEAVFRAKVKSGDIAFKLLAAPLEQLNFEFEEVFKTHVAHGDAGAPLLQSGGSPLERALYDRVYRRDFNGFEENVAIYLDERDAVTWWWRIVARRDWGLQGWTKHKVYPDFLVHLDADKGTVRLLVLETKGQHLAGNKDTEFKRRFFELLEEAYRTGKDAGEVELFAQRPDAMRFRILLDDGAWEPKLEEAIA